MIEDIFDSLSPFYSMAPPIDEGIDVSKPLLGCLGFHKTGKKFHGYLGYIWIAIIINNS
jgi:hypothetical protein